MAKNYQEMAEQILAKVGGKSNVSSVAHCMTRLRLTLKDESLVDDAAVKKISGVMGSQFSGGQYQVIIGQDVPKLCEKVCEIGGYSEQPAIDENLDKKEFSIKSVLNGLMNGLASCLTPLIPALLVSGMIKMVVSVFGDMLGWIAAGSDLYVLLTFVGDAGMYFFPVMVAYSGSKKFGTNTIISIFLAGILLHPTYTGLVSAGTSFTVFGIPMPLVTYSSTVVPMVLVTWVQSYIEKFLKKYIPTVLSTICVPLFTLVIMLPLELCVLGPLGSYIATYLIAALNWLYQVAGPLGIAVIAALYLPIVGTGMHLPLVSLVIINITTLGYDTILAGALVSIYALAAIDLALAIKGKDDETRSLGFSCFVAQMLGGVGEPGIFGILFRYKKALAWSIIGSFAGGLYIGITHTLIYTLGTSNFLMAVMYAGGSTANFVNGIIGSAIAAAVSFVLMMIFGYEDKK